MHIFGRFTALMALLGALFSTSTALGAKLHHGTLEDGVYYSSTGSFDIVLPQGSKIFDGAHPLGGYLVISKLQKPKLLWGLSYNKVAMKETGLDEEAERGIIQAGRDFWAQSYEGAPLDIISQEWINVGGQPALFTLPQKILLLLWHIKFVAGQLRVCAV